MSKNINTTLPAPFKSENIPARAQWLSGEGAGSWFHIEEAGSNFMVTRYSPSGNVECEGIFHIAGSGRISLQDGYKFIHLSHCKKVRLSQGNKVFDLIRIE